MTFFVKVRKALDDLRGHRTFLLSAALMVPLTVRMLMLGDEAFARALEHYAALLVGLAAVLAGSKAASGIRDRLRRKIEDAVE